MEGGGLVLAAQTLAKVMVVASLTSRVKVRIGRFQEPGIEGFVESWQTVAANFNTARTRSASPGTDKIHEENDSKESSKLATV